MGPAIPPATSLRAAPSRGPLNLGCRPPPLTPGAARRETAPAPRESPRSSPSHPPSPDYAPPPPSAVSKILKLALPAGKANPSPPVGPALGAAGVNIMGFCKEYNAATQVRPARAPGARRRAPGPGP